MEERHIRVQRTARYHTLGDARSARSVWMVVHGYGQLARFFLNGFTELADDRYIVAPEGLSRYYLDAAHQRVGASWMTREDREHEIADQIDHLDALYATVRMDTGEIPLGVLGFSQGVATVARWLTHGRTRAERIVLWGGRLPPELTTAQFTRGFRGVRTILVHGRQDQLVPESVWRANGESLQRAGAAVQYLDFPGAHDLDDLVVGKCLVHPMP